MQAVILLIIFPALPNEEDEPAVQKIDGETGDCEIFEKHEFSVFKPVQKNHEKKAKHIFLQK
jgi:hypothetical protein